MVKGSPGTPVATPEQDLHPNLRTSQVFLPHLQHGGQRTPSLGELCNPTTLPGVSDVVTPYWGVGNPVLLFSLPWHCKLLCCVPPGQEGELDLPQSFFPVPFQTSTLLCTILLLTEQSGSQGGFPFWGRLSIRRLLGPREGVHLLQSCLFHI